jgi:branched-chain amino acid transport system substrate-binding protein
MGKPMWVLIVAAAFHLSALGAPPAHAQHAAGAKAPIVIGQTTSLAGPAAAFAKPVSDALRATVDAANRGGGIGGRPIRLVVMDDGFDPARAVDNAKRLLDDGAIALVGPNGAPATQLLTPLARDRRVPIVGATQGAPALREFEPTRFYLRASYRDEVMRIVAHVKALGLRRISVAYFDNPFGQEGARMVQQAAQAAEMEFVGQVPISTDVEKTRAAAGKLAEGQPQVVLLYSLVQPAAEFVRAYRLVGVTQFYSISVVSADALYAAIGDASQGVVVAQLFPAPNQTANRVVANCNATLSSAGITPMTYAHLEGCIIGGVTIEALRRAGGDATSAKLIDTLSNGSFDLGGYAVSFGPKSRNGSNFVELTMVARGGRTVR